MKSVPHCDPLEETMAEASKEYLATGGIPDVLLQCFDQDGRWLGLTAASEFLHPKAEDRLAELTIPESRRTITLPNGESILLTSFMLKEDPEDDRIVEEYLTEEELPEWKDPTLVLPWHEIRGMCQIEIHRNLYCPNLRRFNPHYNSVDMCALTIRLPELTEVCNITLAARHVSIPKIERAQYLSFETASHAEAPSLQYVDNLNLGSAYSARFPVLQEVSGGLKGFAIREFYAPRLETVNRTKNRHGGLFLTEAWTIDAPSLKYVGCKLDTTTAESFYPLNVTVDGQWLMHPKAERIRIRTAMKGEDIEL